MQYPQKKFEAASVYYTKREALLNQYKYNLKKLANPSLKIRSTNLFKSVSLMNFQSFKRSDCFCCSVLIAYRPRLITWYVLGTGATIDAQRFAIVAKH